MKQLFKKIIVAILTFESRLVLLRYKPKVIAITGSVGKTTTKDALYAVLSPLYRVRKNEKSFNSEIGVPLTVLGLKNAWNSPIGWLKNIFKGLAPIILPYSYPEILILEAGVDRPGDMSQLTSWLKPDIVILTTFSKTPVHVEYFNSPQHVYEEKKKLVHALGNRGHLILNQDDEYVMEAAKIAKSPIITYGSGEDADFRFSDVHPLYDDEGILIGTSCKITTDRGVFPINVLGAAGIQHIFPVVASIATGSTIDKNMVNLISGLKRYTPPRGRMSILRGFSGSIIIDDTYNASPIAVEQAVKTLGNIETKGKKIAILGDMLELGEYSKGQHDDIGSLVAKNNIDYLFTIGLRAQDIAKAANKHKMAKSKIFMYKKSNDPELINKLKDIIGKGDVVLAKGSQSIRVEKTVKEILEDPGEARNLLVRQEKAWKNR